MYKYIITLTLLFSFIPTAHSNESCVAETKSLEFHLLKTEHTVVYPLDTTCKPLLVEEFEVVKGDDNWIYSMNWSTDDHDLWHVQRYEVRVNGATVYNYDEDQPQPLSIDLSNPTPDPSEGLHSFEVRACSSLNGVEFVCGEWQSTATQCEVRCVDQSLPIPSISISEEFNSNGDYTVTWSDEGYELYELQQKINSVWATIDDVSEFSYVYNNQPNGFYKYRVRGHNGNVFSQKSAAPAVTVELEIPTFELLPSQTISGDYTVSWLPVSYDNEVSKYMLRQTDEVGATVIIVDELAYSFDFINQLNNKTYDYEIKACFTNNNCSEYSEFPISVYVELDVPLLDPLPAQSSTGNYIVSWGAVVYDDQDIKYELQEQKDDEGWNTVSAIRSYEKEFNSQATDSTFRYHVRACRLDDNCSDYSAISSISTTDLVVSSLAIYEDIRSGFRTLVWQKNPGHDYIAVPVLGHKILMYDQSDEVIDSMFINIDSPEKITLYSSEPYKYGISACSSTYCGQQLFVNINQLQIGLSEVINKQVLWSQLDTTNPQFKFNFNYPSELLVAGSPNTGKPDQFMIETEFPQANGSTLLETVEINTGDSGQGWQTDWFDYNSMIGNNYKITACNGSMGCGTSSSVVFGAPVTSSNIPQPLWAMEGVRGNSHEINYYKGIELEWEFDGGVTDEQLALVDYIEVSEWSPTVIEWQDFKDGISTNKKRIYYVDDIDQVLFLDRLGYGDYDFELRACHRDRINGDVCSDSSGEFKSVEPDVSLNRIDVNYFPGGFYPDFIDAGWYFEDDDPTKSIHLAWNYSEDASYQPDYFIVQNSSTTQLGSCNETTFQQFKVNNADQINFSDGQYWSTQNSCEDVDRNEWLIKSCVNGVGCGAFIHINSNNVSEQITAPSINAPNILDPIIGGPGDLKTGMWMNAEQRGVGWHFYWASDLRYDSDDYTKYGKTYDLIAYWMAYQQIKGHWTPVWFESELKQVNGDVNGGEAYFEGQLYYHKKIEGGPFAKLNAGVLQVLIGNTNRTANLRMKLNYSDGGLFSPDITSLIPSVKVEGHPYVMNSSDGFIEMEIADIAVDVMQGGFPNGPYAERFGNENDADHYAGVYQLDSDENGFSTHTMLTSIDRGMEINTMALFDNKGLPVWIQGSSCGGEYCVRPDGTYFDDYDLGVRAVNGFDPIGKRPGGYKISDNIVDIGTLGRCFADGNSNNTQPDRFKKARISLNISGSLEYTSADGSSYIRLLNHNNTHNSTNCNDYNLPELYKRASLHDIRFFVNGQNESEVTCDPNDTNGPGVCDIKFSWYTDDDFLSIEPYYTNDGWATSQKLSGLCPGVPIQQYVTTNFQCVISEAGNYQFQLRKDMYDSTNGETITIAESSTLLIAGCNTSHCNGATTPLPAAEAPPIQNHMDDIVADPLNDIVGVTVGAFDIDQSGSANYTLPIYAPKGRGGLAPQMALSYNSSSGSGIAGQGWNLSGLSSISRCIRSKEHDPGLSQYPPVSMTWDDVFCIDGIRMFKVSESDTEIEYRTEIANFGKIVAKKDDAYSTGPKKFDVYTKSGEKWIYGSPGGSFIANNIFPTGGTGAQVLANDEFNTVHTWLIAQIGDNSTELNRIRFGYDTKDGESYLSKVKWSNFGAGESPHYQIDFNYDSEIRTDAMHHYGIGTEYKSLLNLESVSTFIRTTNSVSAPLEEVRRLKLNYEQPYTTNNPTGALRLISAQQCLNLTTCLKPVEFEWDNNDTATGFSAATQDNFSGSDVGALHEMGYGSYKPIDLNGDGHMEMIFIRGYDRGNWLEENLEAKYWIAAKKDTIDLTGVDGTGWTWGSGGCQNLTSGNQYFDVICNTDIQPFHADEYHDYNAEMWFVYDFNSDGFQDILSTRRDGDGFENYQIFLSNGKTICASPAQNGCTNFAPIDTGVPFSFTLSGSAFLDFTGDGLPDLMTFEEVSDSVYQYKIYPSKVIESSHIAPSVIGSYAVDLDSDLLAPKDMVCENVPIPDEQGGGVFDLGLCVNIYGTNDFGSKTFIDKVEVSPTDLNGDGINDLLLTYTYEYLRGGFTDSSTCEMRPPLRFDPNQSDNPDLPIYQARVNDSSEEGALLGSTPGERSDPCEQQFKAYLVAEQEQNGQVKFKYAGRAGILKSTLIYATACEGGDSSSDCNADISSKHDSSRVQDVNGDGLGDFLYLDDSGNYKYQLNLGVTETYTYQPGTPIEYSFEKLQFSDVMTINADAIPNGHLETCNVSDRDDEDVDACSRSYLTQFIDYDLDGDTDVLMPSLIGQNTNSNYQLYRYGLQSNGEFGFGSPISTSIQAFNINSNRQPQDFNNSIWDVNGDSHYDYLSLLRRQDNGDDWDTNQTVKLGVNPWQTRNKVTLIEHQVGGVNLESVITIDYEAATDPNSDVYTKSTGSLVNLTEYGQGSPVFDLLAPMYLVSQVGKTSPIAIDPSSNFNPKPNHRTYMTYDYEGFKVQGGGRGSLGFSSVMSYDQYHDVMTTTDYRQDFPYIGMPELTLTQHGQGELSRSYLEYTHTTFNLPDNHQSLFPYLKRSYEKTHNLNVTANETNSNGYVLTGRFPHKVMLNDFIYSNTDVLHGNLTSSTSRTCVATVPQPTPEENSADLCGESGSKLIISTTTANTYADLVTDDKWFLGRLESTQVISKRKVNGTYQSNTRNSSFKYHPDTGQLTQEVIEGAADQFLRTIYEQNIYGQRENVFQCSSDITEANCKIPPISGRLSTRGSIHRYSKTTYDPVWDEYVEFQTVPFTAYDDFNHTDTVEIENATNYFPLDSGSVYEKNTSTIHADSNMQNNKRDIYGNPYLVSNIHGVMARSVYGSFGEVHASAGETGGSSKMTKRWCEGSAVSTYSCPTMASKVVINQATEKPISRKFYDVLGREIRSQVQNFNGQWQTTDTEYDELGRTVKQSEPYTINAAGQLTSNRYWTETKFDPMDRVILIKSPMHFLESSPTSGEVDEVTTYVLVDVISTTDYIDLTVSTSNSKGQITSQVFDLTGKVIQSIDYEDNVVDYVYDAQDKLKETTSYLNNNPITISMVYDSLGRKTSMSDPDKGSWAYKYNALGELIEQNDANTSGWSVKNWYDIRGRLIYRMDADGSRSIWEYDKYNHHGLLMAEHSRGRYQSEGVAQSITYDYDQFARPEIIFTQVFDEQDSASPTYSMYKSWTVYDGIGRVFQQYDNIDISFDDNHHGLQFLYNQYGYQESIRDAEAGLEGQEYFKVLNVDQRGQVVSERLNDAFNTVRDYEPRTGFLKQIRTYDMFGETTQDLSFAFDEIGNLIRRTDQVIYNGGPQQAVNEIFIYDDLNRLSEVYSDANRGDQTLLRQSLHTYDATGNLRDNNGWNMVYGAQGKPHAVATATHGLLGTKGYQYDANGNVIEINITDNNGSRQSLFAYSSFDKAIKIEAQDNISEVFYNTGRNRYIRKDRQAGETDNRVTHYLGSVEYVYENGQPTKVKRHLGNLVIHIEDNSEIRRNWDYNYILKDHLGSSHTVVNRQGQNVQRFSFDAWGARRNPPAPSSITVFNTFDMIEVWGELNNEIDETTNRGFTGHEHFDQVGIIHMNGRIYDPSIGRFLQADPIIQDPYNTQSLNRYSYVMNNPLSYTDPSGYSRLRKGWWRMPLSIAAMFVPLPGINGYLAAFIRGALSGSISTGNLKGALKGGIQAALTYGIAHGGPKGAGWVKARSGRALAHATVAGVSAEVDGGKFGHGFSAAILTQGLSETPLGKFMQSDKILVSVVSNAIVQGTVSELTGGKFANGAMSGAFRAAFNDAFDHKEKRIQAYAKDQMKTEVYGNHFYGLSTDMCMSGPMCNVPMIASIADAESIPFMEHKLGRVDILGFDPIDHFHRTNTDGSISIINLALPGHTFGGKVVHTIREKTNGMVNLTTIGDGFGWNPSLNEFVGGVLFSKMHFDVALKYSQNVQELQNYNRKK